MKPLKLIILLILFIGLVSVTACSVVLPQEEAVPEPLAIFTISRPPERVPVTVIRGDIEIYETHVAVSIPIQSETLHFTVNGIPISGIYVRVGDTVSAGDLIASLGHEPDGREEFFLQLETNALLRLELLNMRHSYALMIAETTNVPFDDSYFMLERRVIHYELDNIRYDLNRIRGAYVNYEMRAGIDGTVVRAMNRAEGMLSSMMMPVAVINDRTRMGFLLDRKPDEIFGSIGDRVEIRVGAGTFWAEVIDNDEHGFGDPVFMEGGFLAREEENRVYLTVDDQSELPPGVHALVNIVSASAHDVLKIPAGLVRTMDGETVVFVMENGTRRVRHVEVGIVSRNYIEIISGLEEGEEIVR